MADEVTVLDDLATPIARLDRYAGDDDTYQEVVSWTVDAGYRGELSEIAFMSSNYSKTEFKLVIAGTTQFTDIVVGAAVSLPFKGNKLASASVVILYARSPDGITSITVDGSITGKLLEKD